MKNLRMWGAIGVLASLVSIVRPGAAANYVWNNGSTDFNAAGNWTPSGPPAGGDRAVFSLSATYGVDVTAAITNADLSVQNGDVTFNPNGKCYYATNISIATQRFTQASFTMNGTTGAFVNLYMARDGSGDGAGGQLTISGGARLASSNATPAASGTIQISGNGNPGNFNSTGTVTVAGAGSELSCQLVDAGALYLGWGAEARMYITNGGLVRCGNFYANHYSNTKTNVPIRSVLYIGGGSGSSELYTKKAVNFNDLGTFPNGYKTGREPMTFEMVLLPNGRFYGHDGLATLGAGTILTLAGGAFYINQFDVVLAGSTCRGFGMITNGTGYTKNLSFRRSSGLSKSGGITVTNYATLSPGTPESPVGSIYAGQLGYVDFWPGCTLNFDLAGTNTTEYDRFLASKATLYLGSNASPYTVQGGAIVNVALTNNFVPGNRDTFDIITAKDIVDTDLSLITFNYPATPPGAAWSNSIVQFVNGSITTEVLRLTYILPPPGTIVRMR